MTSRTVPRQQARRGRRIGALACSALLLAALPSPATASESASETEPTAAPSWPPPGDRATEQPALEMSGRPVTVQLLAEPLNAVEEDVEAGPGASFTLSADVLFDSGEDVLTPEASEALTVLAETMRESGVAGPALVVGHTDDEGEDAFNLDLSQRRARTVSTRLAPELDNTGITLVPEGRGEAEPLAPNADDASRARNRRVSVVFATPAPETSTSSESRDISVGALTPAPAAPATGGPSGTLAATQRTIPIGDEAEQWTVRLDVVRAEAIDGVVAVETRTRLVAGPGEDSFGEYGALFSGDTLSDDPAASAVYDLEAARRHAPVINAEGTLLGSSFSGALERDGERLGWLMFPLPSPAAEDIDLYVPAFGFLTVPVERP